MAYYTPLCTSHICFLKYLKRYKLTFVFLKRTLHIGTCKAALSVQIERVLPDTCEARSANGHAEGNVLLAGERLTVRT